MKKYIIVSVNQNCDYLYFLPLTCAVWQKFGWTPIVMYQGQVTYSAVEAEDRSPWHKIFDLVMDQPFDAVMVGVGRVNGYRSDTITQISRLYASCLTIPEDAYLMTSDVDMIPLSDYWKPDPSTFTVWGHDLTGFKNFPICYIGATVRQWRQVMNIDGTDHQFLIQRDLMSLPQAKSQDFYTYWETDQDHITNRLKQFGTHRINFVQRGQGTHGFARGRVDKGHGGWVLDQPELIDAHLLQQCHHTEEKIQKLMDLLHHVWPKDNWLWFLQYTKEFKKLAV